MTHGNYKHGEVLNGKHSKLYYVWQEMKKRTERENNKDYKNYGGRGIKVCDEWKNNSSSFFVWAKSNGYEEGLQINRIDNDGDYTPDNCNFITGFDNKKNRRYRSLNVERNENYGIYKRSGNNGYIVKLRIFKNLYYGGNFKNIDIARKMRDELVKLINKLNS